jgi:hypothetical protein
MSLISPIIWMDLKWRKLWNPFLELWNPFLEFGHCQIRTIQILFQNPNGFCKAGCWRRPWNNFWTLSSTLSRTHRSLLITIKSARRCPGFYFFPASSWSLVSFPYIVDAAYDTFEWRQELQWHDLTWMARFYMNYMTHLMTNEHECRHIWHELRHGWHDLTCRTWFYTSDMILHE